MNVSKVTTNLIIINILVWLASIMCPRYYGIDLVSLLGLHYWRADSFGIWQLFTYMFMHDTSSIQHIFFNMFGVWMFGRSLEQVWSGGKFLFFYIVVGVGAGIVQEIVWAIDIHPLLSAMNEAIASNSGEPLVPFAQHFTGGDIATITAPDTARLKAMFLNRFVTVGASGALFGILLAFGWLFPQAKMMLIFFPIPIPARVFVALYAIAELVFGIANFQFDNVAHYAHLGGMLAGAIILFMWKKQGCLYSRGNGHFGR